jgi:capsular exopolysaccharide synthesis family protein
MSEIADELSASAMATLEGSFAARKVVGEESIVGADSSWREAKDGDLGKKVEPCLANCVEVDLPDNHDHPAIVSGGGPSVAPALEAYKSLRRKLMNIRADQGVRSVAVTSAAPSDGKTVTAFNLAYCCAQLDAVRVLLIDADLRTQALSDLFTKLPAVGLRDVLSGMATYENAIVRTASPNLYMMGAGTSTKAPAELLSTDKWDQFIQWANQSFDLVVVDSVPVGIVVDFDLIASGCDGVLVVVRALKSSRKTLRTALDQIETKKIIGVVWNGFHQSSSSKDYLYG